MAFKLKKTEIDTLLDHAHTIRDLHDKIEDAVSAYNNKLSEIKGFVDDLAAGWRSEYDDKSEAWQNGERGEAANEFIEKWEAISQDHDDLETPESSVADDLEALDHELS